MRRTGKRSESPYNEVNTTAPPCKRYTITEISPLPGSEWRPTPVRFLIFASSRATGPLPKVVHDSLRAPGRTPASRNVP